MDADETVVRKCSKLSKPELHAEILKGWARGISRHGGQGAFADKLEISTTALGKHLTGSLPCFETLDKALDAEPTVLDDYLKRKGKRLVDEDAVCDVDDMGLLLARVLVMIQEAEHPNGPGGRTVVPQEFLAGESIMRDLNAASARWLEKCSEIRRPRAVPS